MEVKHRCQQFLKLGFPLGGLAKLFAQDWEGDVTVVMPATLTQYSKIIQNPSHLELQKALNQGRRCTWEKLSAIKANCGIELALDECVNILNHMCRLRRSAERAAAAASHGGGLPSTVRFNASKRIPSWNCIARENSTGSLDEVLLTDAASSLHHGGDGSVSDTESVEHSSWTISGGPLMRTTSADKFIDFVQNLEVHSRLNRGIPTLDIQNDNGRELSSSSQNVTTTRSEYDQRQQQYGGVRRSVSGSSIMVAEGDLLHPEMINNGIVFNVVKKEDLSPTNRPQNSDHFSESVVECVQLDCPEREPEASSGSEYDGDNDVRDENLQNQEGTRSC